jgi:hypothetical protein
LRIGSATGIRGGVATLVLAALLALPAAAAAAEPLKIREVFPGSTATDPKAEFVELQMTADGQDDVAGQELRFYDAAGDPIVAATYALTALDAEGLVAETQRTILLASPEAVAAAGALGGDIAAPDATMSAGLDRIDPAGGAVCFTAAGGGTPADCVAWGSFPIPGPFEAGVLPDSQTANAAAIADGSALRRDISPGCQTYLDGPDDSGSSAADFDPVAPAPRNNADEPSEIRCPPGTGIVSGPVTPFANPTNSADASFAYTALPAEPGVEFQCHLDFSPSAVPAATPPSEGEWVECNTQPQAYVGLADGFYRFWARALGENPDPGPPTNRAWQIDTAAPQTTIDSTPPSPNSGFSVKFGYSSSEPLSSFRCQLDDGAIQNCGSSSSSGSKSYFGLIDGSHTFRVWAKDNAGNEDPTAAEHSFTVQTALGDSTPPDTQILLAPSNPSTSPNAFFAYGSSEPNSSFECRLDGAPFAACPDTGVAYGPLANGNHSFEVRAIDRGGNVDSIPAAHIWRVAAAVPNTRITKAPAGSIRSRRGRPVSVSFGFKADKPGVSFRCRLDLSGPYRPCKSPHRFKAKPGRHVFEVFATDSLGNEEGSPAFRIFNVRAPGAERSFFVQEGRFLSSLAAKIAPTKLPRRGTRPVSLRFGATFENLDGSDIPGLKTMTLKLARGGVLNARGLPRCTRAKLAQRNSSLALAACRPALVGKGTVSTALRFPEGRRSRATARLLLFNARGGLLMHIYTTQPLEGTFIVPLKVSSAKGRFGTVLRARFPRLAAGFGQVTGFEMTLQRSFRFAGKKRSYLLAGCPAPRGLNRVSFELAQVDFRFQAGLRIRNSTINTCRATG